MAKKRVQVVIPKAKAKQGCRIELGPDEYIVLHSKKNALARVIPTAKEGCKA